MSQSFFAVLFQIFFFTSAAISICEKIIATNISAQPKSSRPDIIWCRIIAPAMVATTDSKLIISEATVEDDENFCPITWKVYATPQESTPAKRMGPMVFAIRSG